MTDAEFTRLMRRAGKAYNKAYALILQAEADEVTETGLLHKKICDERPDLAN